MKTGWTFHVRKLHIERSNDTWISSLKDNPSSTNLFITWKSKTIYNGEPQPLKVSQSTNSYLPPSGVYLYYLSAKTILWNKPKNYFQSQSNVNSLESGTITTIYKYEQTLWSKWVHSARVTSWHAWLLLWIVSMTPFHLLLGESPSTRFWTF